MKLKFLLLFFIFLNATIGFSQTQRSVVRVKTSFSNRLDYSKIYNVKTDRKISERKFKKILKKNNGRFSPKFYYDKYGKIEKIYVSKNGAPIGAYAANIAPVQGEPFPEFVFQTISGDQLDLADLKGKIVLLRFERNATQYKFLKDQMQQVEGMLNELGMKDAIVPVLVTNSSREDIISNLPVEESSFHFVPNGFSFAEKYHVRRMPTTFLIDKKGILIKTIHDYSNLDLKMYK